MYDNMNIHAPLRVQTHQMFEQCFTSFFNISFAVMIPTISLFAFKNRRNKRGEVKIYIRFTQDRKSSYKCTNIALPSNMWDFAKGKVKSTYKLCNAVNMLLEKQLSEIRQDLMVTAMKTKHISSTQAKKLVFNKLNLSFFKLSEEVMDNFEKDGKIGMRDRIKTVFAKFEEFLGSKNATFYDIDEKVLLDFQNHLRTKYENKVNTIQGNMKIIRRIFSIAIERSIITSNDDPFKNVKIRQEKSIRDFLTEDEVIRLSKLDLEEGSYLERVRDVFIWTIFSGGLRISDVLLLRKSNFEANVLTLIIQKTKTPHRVTLPENAYKVLMKYIEQIKVADGFAFGLLEERFNGVSAIELDKAVTGATQKYNKALKVLASMAGINKTVGSHQARISFVTIAAQNGVPLTTIQGIVCHAKLEMTAHYSKFVDNQGDTALLNLEKSIFKISTQKSS